MTNKRQRGVAGELRAVRRGDGESRDTELNVRSAIDRRRLHYNYQDYDLSTGDISNDPIGLDGGWNTTNLVTIS
jgi:hypothetical protein